MSFCEQGICFTNRAKYRDVKFRGEICGSFKTMSVSSVRPIIEVFVFISTLL